MRKLEINDSIYYCHTKSGNFFMDFQRTRPVPASFFSEAEHTEIQEQLGTDKRKNNTGGARENSGRKLRTTEKQKNRNVMLTDSEYNYLLFKHGGSFSEAVRSLLPLGWEFEEC